MLPPCPRECQRPSESKPFLGRHPLASPYPVPSLATATGALAGGAEPSLAALKPESTSGDWARFVIPSSAFSCYNLGDMTHLEMQNPNAVENTVPTRDASFCLGEVQLVE